MKVTEAFLGEHGVFYAQFDRLDTAIPSAQTVPEVREQAALLASALMPHATLEDELLFSHLEGRLGAESGPLPVLRGEHDQIEDALASAQEARDLAGAKRDVLHAVELAREHFAKEEQILFPLAERVLDDRTLRELGELWARRRSVRVG